MTEPPAADPYRMRPEQVPTGWGFLVCPHCLGVLPCPPDQTDAEKADQLRDHITLCPAEQPPLPRAAPPPSTELGRCTSSGMPDGGHCLCWREGRGEPCCTCGWQPWDDGLASA